MTGLRLGQVPDFERFPLLGERADEVLTLVATRAKLGTSQQILLVFLTALRESEVQESPQSPKWPSAATSSGSQAETLYSANEKVPSSGNEPCAPLRHLLIVVTNDRGWGRCFQREATWRTSFF